MIDSYLPEEKNKSINRTINKAYFFTREYGKIN